MRSHGWTMRPSSTSSMARAFRCTRRATRCARTRATCGTSRQPCRRWSRSTRALPAREIILDGEVIALRPDGGPAAVPGHHAPVRTPPGRRCDAARVAADPLLLRCPCPRRCLVARHAAGGPLCCACAAARPPRSCLTSFGRRARRRSALPQRPSRAATKASWRRRSARATPPAAAGPRGSRSSRRARSISWCSPRSGGTGAAAAG